jgi:hypothetical protein
LASRTSRLPCGRPSRGRWCRHQCCPPATRGGRLRSRGPSGEQARTTATRRPATVARAGRMSVRRLSLTPPRCTVPGEVGRHERRQHRRAAVGTNAQSDRTVASGVVALSASA